MSRGGVVASAHYDEGGGAAHEFVVGGAHGSWIVGSMRRNEEA